MLRHFAEEPTRKAVVIAEEREAKEALKFAIDKIMGRNMQYYEIGNILTVLRKQGVNLHLQKYHD